MASPGEMSQSQEDYLEAIAMIGQGKRPVRIREIADWLEVSRPSVTGAVSVLVAKGLALHEPYGGVELSPEGERLAADLVRRHRVLSRFLREGLRLPAELADRDACRLEHAMSEQTFQRLEGFIIKFFESREGVSYG